MNKAYNGLFQLLYQWDADKQQLIQVGEVPPMGIYSLVSGGHAYIGSSKKLPERLKCHIRTVFHGSSSGSRLIRDYFHQNGMLSIYLLREVRDVFVLYDLEAEYLRLLKPDCNGLNCHKDFEKLTISVPEGVTDKLDCLKFSRGHRLFEGIPNLGRGKILSIALDEFIENHKNELRHFFELYADR